MSEYPWAPLPPPRTESRFFNAYRRTVSLLVEAGVDQRFWRIHCSHECLVRHHGQGGREAVLRALDEARGDPEAVLLAALDADLDRLEGTLPDRDDVVWTDAHDLEATLLGLPTLEKILRQHLDPEKLKEAQARWGERFRERLFRHAVGLGRLRWLKRRRHPDLETLKFKKPKKDSGLALFAKYRKSVGGDWSPSAVLAIRKIIEFSGAQHLKAEELQADCDNLPEADAAQLCNGHDLLGFLQAGLKELGCEVREGLEAQLLLACERVWIVKTEMWQRIQEWEEAHPGYRVLESP